MIIPYILILKYTLRSKNVIIIKLFQTISVMFTQLKP